MEIPGSAGGELKLGDEGQRPPYLTCCIGHNAIDVGGAYTYFDPKVGHEFSATLGFTYNFENEHTQYQNGIDMRLDWGASHS